MALPPLLDPPPFPPRPVLLLPPLELELGIVPEPELLEPETTVLVELELLVPELLDPETMVVAELELLLPPELLELLEPVEPVQLGQLAARTATSREPQPVTAS